MTDLWAGRPDTPPTDPRSSDDGAVGPDELWGGRRAPRPSRVVVTRPVQWGARVVLVALLVGLPVLVGWVGLDLLSVRSSLQTSREALGDLQAAAAEFDLERSETALSTAQERIADASRRSQRPTWSVAARLPVLGPSVAVTRDVVEVASAATDVAARVVRDGQRLVGSGVQVQVVDGRVDLTPLQEASALLASLPLERLVEAREALAQPRDGWLPAQIVTGRDDVLALADDTIGTLARGRALTDALPGFLGADGPRAYFVGLQTSAELRGTGGMVGFWGVLSVDDGRIQFGATADHDPFDDRGAPVGETRTSRVQRIGLSSTPPDGVDAAFQNRYGFADGARYFPNVNLDPDLPTTAATMLALFEHQTGQRLDGVVLLDPVGLQELVAATGRDVALPDGVAELLDRPVLPADELARFALVDVYEDFGFDRSDERNEILRGIGDAAFAQVFDGRWESQAMARAVVAAASQRHLQVFATDADVQAAFSDVEVTGELLAPPGVDRFAVVANNMVGGKQDVHLGHEFAFEVHLDDVRRDDAGTYSALRRVGLQATVDNPLPSSGMDPYVIGNCVVPGRASRCFEGVPGENHTWFSVWAPPTLEVGEFTSDDGVAPHTLAAGFRSLRVVDHAHRTPSRSRASFGLEGDGRVVLDREVSSVVYEFAWWRQAKAVPDLLDVRVVAPAGWAIADVEVVGGGAGTGMGVHGDGVPLEVSSSAGEVRVRGTVTADTRLRVHLAAAGA